MFTKAFISGAFETLHTGHKYILSQAKSYADQLIVAVNHDDYIREVKNREPLFPLQTRIDAIRELNIADIVVALCSNTPIKLIEQWEPDFIVVGDDYPLDKIVGRHLAQVIIIERLPGFSTTKIVNNMKTNAKHYLP